ncbi:MAG: hypothetical protein II683_04310 [Muribaculaceae bacterium]|nr:hypothetical protein [Muribaculaceae bacterium]
MLDISCTIFGTACNVTGDGAIALIVDKFFRNKTASPGEEEALEGLTDTQNL